MVAMANSTTTPLTARLARWRGWIQAAFLLLWLDPFMLRVHTVCAPVFHCYSCPLAAFACPIGVVAQFTALHVFPFVAVGMLVIFAAALGTFFCGYACPFGYLQDLVGRLPTPKFVLPAWAGYGRYVVLVAFVLAIPYLFGNEHPLFICTLCPAGALEGALPNVAKAAMAGNEVTWPSAVKLTILGVVVTAMFFTWRPWCRLLCPLGAIYGLFNRASIFFLRYTPGNCKACELCSSFCKYGVLPKPGLNVAGCIRCLDCTRCNAISFVSVLGSSDRTKAGTPTGPSTESN